MSEGTVLDCELTPLQQEDPEVFDAIHAERERESYHLELIPSENTASAAVMEAQGSILTNKYAEGYPGRRYYGGCECVDVVERLAIDRAKRLFGAEHVNVQPHSGSQANMSAYMALLKPGDTIMGMELDHGGHLTHGSSVSFSGTLYKVAPYGVDRETETIDYDHLLQLARKASPAAIVAGATAYPRTLEFEKFREIADAVGAYLIVDIAHIAGLVAADLHPSPVPWADVVTTTTHKTLRGPRGGMILCKSGYASRVDKAVFPGVQGGPLMHVIAAKAVALKEAMKNDFVDYQRRTVDNARRLAAELASREYRLVAGGTDTHLVLVDVTSKGLRGDQAEKLLDRAGLTVNKNAIPFDTKPPRITSGIRLGTPVLSTRGMGPEEMARIAAMIDGVLSSPDDEKTIDSVKSDVRELCMRFPLDRWWT